MNHTHQQGAPRGEQPARFSLHTLRSFIGRMAGARLKHGDCGGMLEVEVLNDHTATLADELKSCATEAKVIEQTERDVDAYVAKCLADPTSPGVIDAKEAAGLRRRLANLDQQAKHHTAHLNALA